MVPGTRTRGLSPVLGLGLGGCTCVWVYGGVGLGVRFRGAYACVWV